MSDSEERRRKDKKRESRNERRYQGMVDIGSVREDCGKESRLETALCAASVASQCLEEKTIAPTDRTFVVRKRWVREE